MATTIKLTKAAIDAVPLPPAGKRAIYHFDGIAGLELRVSSTGVKTFSIVMRPAGKKPERVTLGRYPGLSPEQVKRRALEAISKLAGGQSVVAEKKLTKIKAKTLAEVFIDYQTARKDLKKTTVADMERALKETFADWLSKPLDKITPTMVQERHAKHGKDHSEARANLAMRYLRALFNYAQAEYQDDEGKPLVDVNPVRKLSQTKAWYRVDRRQTVIKPHELGAWVNAVLALPGAEMRDYFMTVLLTGLRRQEALKLTWGNVDMDGKTFTIVDPKNHRDHTLPLSDFLLELFTRRKAVTVSEFVFADHLGRRVSNFRCAQAAIEKASGVSFCIHDLRRTFATVAESLDIPAYALKRLLNHANGADVTAGYIVANVERLRDPMQKITDYVLKSAGIKETAEVISLEQKRQHG
ncbi:MAG: tyrosine-type recombinase/integrase [Methylococcaceae bacterium]|nr:tyrosine-type recombinase/integrase [Methylococcaceae bacterium]